MENRLDHLFRKLLSQHEESPALGTWDEINKKLVSRRRKMWSKRLAMAASILLLVSAGFVGYRYFNSLTTSDVQILSESKEESMPPKEIGTNATSEINTQQHRGPGEIPGKEETENQDVAQVKVEPMDNKKPVKPLKIAKAPATPENKKINEEASTNRKVPELAVAESKEEPVMEQVTPKQDNTITLAEKEMQGPEPERRKTKTYPKVKIVYKADKHSKLVASGKKDLLGKGITKITEFTDEHLLTTNFKTKLRNAKEDLLALDFGKLLTNKSNNEFEN